MLRISGTTSTAMYCVELGMSNVKGARQSYRVASSFYRKVKGDVMLAGILPCKESR